MLAVLWLFCYSLFGETISLLLMLAIWVRTMLVATMTPMVMDGDSEASVLDDDCEFPVLTLDDMDPLLLLFKTTPTSAPNDLSISIYI